MSGKMKWARVRSENLALRHGVERIERSDSTVVALEQKDLQQRQTSKVTSGRRLIACPRCSTLVKRSHLEKHIKKVHEHSALPKTSSVNIPKYWQIGSRRSAGFASVKRRNPRGRRG